VFFILVLAVVGLQAYNLFIQRRDYVDELMVLMDEAKRLETENQLLSDDLEYYQDDENLLKEVKARFNYKDPSEELLILVPALEE